MRLDTDSQTQTILWCTVNYQTFHKRKIASADKDYSIRKDINFWTQLLAWFLNFLSQNVN